MVLNTKHLAKELDIHRNISQRFILCKVWIRTRGGYQGKYRGGGVLEQSPPLKKLLYTSLTKPHRVNKVDVGSTFFR